MKTGFLEDLKQVSVSVLAPKLAAAPALLGVTNGATLSVVAFQRDAAWTPFAASLTIGSDGTEAPFTMIDATGVRLVRLQGDITLLADADALADFVQAWRTAFQPGVFHEELSPTANVRWHSSAPERSVAPHWEISLYEKRHEDGQQAPGGKFANLRANIPPSSIGELAGRWLGDPTLREANMPSRETKIRISDNRAFFSGSRREGHDVSFVVAHDARLSLIASATCEPRAVNREPMVREVVDGTVSFSIPDAATHLLVVLTDLDDVRYDEIHLRVSDYDPAFKRRPIDSLLGAAAVETPDSSPLRQARLTPAEERLAFALGKISDGLSQCYQQAALDLNEESRLSWVGTAAALREVVRGAIDHVTRDGVVPPPYEDERKAPTMTDRVLHFLRARDSSDADIGPIEQSVRILDELFARLPRMLYVQASKGTHALASRKDALRIKACTDLVLAELLDAH